MSEMQEMQEIEEGALFVMGIASLMLFLSSIVILPDLMHISKAFGQSKAIALFASGFLFGAGILTMCFFVSDYAQKYGEELLFNVLFASGGMAFGALLIFQMIIDSAGLYFLSVWAPVLGYFAVAVILAVALHRHWTSPYIPKDIEDAARVGMMEDVIDDVLVRG